MSITTLPTDSGARKEYPLLRGFFRYFPAAVARVANLSKRGNDKHNPGEDMHHARGKSTDHGDCILRHTMDAEDLKAWLERCDKSVTPADFYARQVDAYLDELTQRAWRANAELQEACERYCDAPLAPGAKLPAAPVLPDCSRYDPAESPAAGGPLLW